MKLASSSFCTGCAACASICPQRAIAFSADAEGFVQPEINGAKCIQCGLCKRVCPVFQSLEPKSSPQACYSLRIKDREILRASSSGGAFTCFARIILARGGCVFGCVMDAPDWVARHVMAGDEAGIAKMRGSKYIQSQVGNTFRECEHELKQGRWVLYVGTPCQIRGLRNYLRREYDTLLTVDFICHGVPSPLVWHTYLRRVVKFEPSQIRRISFRDKICSWKRYSLSLSFDNRQKNFSETLDKNLYLKAFIGNFALRKSCYSCPAKGGRSGSDLTLSDFWRVEEIRPELYDSLGVSACLVHTEKGASFVLAVKDLADVHPVELEEIIRANPSYLRSVDEPRGRSIFMRGFGKAKSWNRLLLSSRRGPFFAWLGNAFLRRVRRFVKLGQVK